MTTLKTTLEDLIKAERALEAALVHTLTNCSAFRTAGNTDAVELICRERRDLDKAQQLIRNTKERLQALAEHAPVQADKLAKHEQARQRGLWQRRHRLNVVERAELVELNQKHGTYTGPDVTRGTKREKTVCPYCTAARMPGQITCAAQACQARWQAHLDSKHEHAN
jgi:hypothetical protein